MTNQYMPMSTTTKLGEFYEFVERVTEQADFNDYFEAIVEMAKRRNPMRTERECQEIAYENLHRCLWNSTPATLDAREWLEALRPDGYTAFIER